MYAKWQPNDYTVTLNANGGEVNPSTVAVQYDANYNFSGNLPTPTRRGYDFQGWFTDPTNGSQVTNDTKMTTPNAHTLYAHWKIQTYNVNITVNGNATISKTPIQIEYNGTSQVTITPSSGYLVRSVSCTSGYTATGTTGRNAQNAQTYTIKNSDYVDGGTCTFTIALFQYTTTDFNCTGNSYKVEGDCKRDYVADDCSCAEWNTVCDEWNQVCDQWEDICLEYNKKCTKYKEKCTKYNIQHRQQNSWPLPSTDSPWDAWCAGYSAQGYDDCDCWTENNKEVCQATKYYTNDDQCIDWEKTSECEPNGWVDDKNSCKTPGKGDCTHTKDGDTCLRDHNTTCKRHNECPHTDNSLRQYYCADTGYHITSGQTCEFT